MTSLSSPTCVSGSALPARHPAYRQRALLGCGLALLVSTTLVGQVPVKPRDATATGQAHPRSKTAPFPESADATVNQLMRGLFFPASNVVFAGQGDDPATITQDIRGSASTDLLRSVFGGWEAIENSSLALAEAATLLLLPGRTCSNGRIAPVAETEWRQYSAQMREVALVSFRAARDRDQVRLSDSTEMLTAACSNCHRAYRQGGLERDPQLRCVPRAVGGPPVPKR